MIIIQVLAFHGMIIMLSYPEYIDTVLKLQNLSPNFLALDRGTQQWNHLSNFGKGQYKEHEVRLWN